MKVIFYKAEHGTLLDKAIAFWTKGKYSHCEIYNPNDGYCYSASSRQKGVRRQQIPDFETNGKWDIFDLNISEEYLLTFYEETKDKKYDWLGIFLSKFINLGLQNKNKWYCSEWVARVLLMGTNWYSDYTLETNLSPNELYKKIQRYLLDSGHVKHTSLHSIIISPDINELMPNFVEYNKNNWIRKNSLSSDEQD